MNKLQEITKSSGEIEPPTLEEFVATFKSNIGKTWKMLFCVFYTFLV